MSFLEAVSYGLTVAFLMLIFGLFVFWRVERMFSPGRRFLLRRFLMPPPVYRYWRSRLHDRVEKKVARAESEVQELHELSDEERGRYETAYDMAVTGASRARKKLDEDPWNAMDDAGVALRAAGVLTKTVPNSVERKGRR